MRQLSLACLFVLAALAMTGCAKKQFLAGGCTSCASGGCSSCMTCKPGTGRAYGQNSDQMVCRGGGAGLFGNSSVCSACGGHGCGACGHSGYFASGWRGGCHNDAYRMDQPPYGPQGAQVAYPYYTTRGPRDYFADNPPSIGP